MNLMYLSSARIPTKNAHGIQIVKMCEAFACEGVNVELVVPKRNNLLVDDPYSFYNVKHNFCITYLSSIDLYPLRWIPEIISFWILQLSFMVSARVHLFFNAYDIVYSREVMAGLFFPGFVYEVHSPESISKGTQWLWRRARYFVSISQHGAQVLADCGIKRQKIFVSPDAVDLYSFEHKPTQEEARKKLGIDLEKKIVLYAGNFKSWKGVDVLAEATAYFSDEFYTLFVGGTKEDDVRRLSQMISSVKGIVVPFVPHTLIPTYLASADVLVLPNTAKDDNARLFTSPLKLFEYMASERPIVASKLPSFQEVVNDDMVTFFEPDNAHDLARAVFDVLQHKDEANKKTVYAAKEVRRYTWQRRAQRILEHIN